MTTPTPPQTTTTACATPKPPPYLADPMAEAFLGLRSAHMLFGILWAGGTLFRAMALARARGDEASRDTLLASAWMGPYIGVTSLATFGFGLAAMLTNSSEIAYKFEGLGDGFFLFHGALGMATFAILIGFLGHFMIDRKLIRVIAAKGTEAFQEARYAVLTSRAYLVSYVTSALIVAAVLGMTFFRTFQ